MKATIWHGSTNIVERPQYSDTRPFNDFGPGFYCTEHEDLAKEWACCSAGTNGYANKYELDITGLTILNLCSSKHNILNWIALLLDHRSFNPSSEEGKSGVKYLLENFLPNTKGYDMIIGYRADDSYFSIAKAFINNKISLRQLKNIVAKCDPGKQIVIKSERAFTALICVDSEATNSSEFYVKRKNRDEVVRMGFINELMKNDSGIYMRDIIKGEMKNDDPRIQ